MWACAEAITSYGNSWKSSKRLQAIRLHVLKELLVHGSSVGKANTTFTFEVTQGLESPAAPGGWKHQIVEHWLGDGGGSPASQFSLDLAEAVLFAPRSQAPTSQGPLLRIQLPVARFEDALRGFIRVAHGRDDLTDREYEEDRKKLIRLLKPLKEVSRPAILISAGLNTEEVFQQLLVYAVQQDPNLLDDSAYASFGSYIQNRLRRPRRTVDDSTLRDFNYEVLAHVTRCWAGPLHEASFSAYVASVARAVENRSRTTEKELWQRAKIDEAAVNAWQGDTLSAEQFLPAEATTYAVDDLVPYLVVREQAAFDETRKRLYYLLDRHDFDGVRRSGANWAIDPEAIPAICDAFAELERKRMQRTLVKLIEDRTDRTHDAARKLVQRKVKKGLSLEEIGRHYITRDE